MRWSAVQNSKPPNFKYSGRHVPFFLTALYVTYITEYN